MIWGSGIKQAEMTQLDPETDGLSLDHRLDINQVDLSPLMSTILSIPVPVNSRVSYSKMNLMCLAYLGIYVNNIMSLYSSCDFL